ncbi:MAG: bifunctional phosphoribosyl-AMP cyclohydrolase/phosphoribosyl-ATP diphosphatase HisIE [Planctomycetes bacterium]|nr:bifunctional phosphoribosyl-AMP cyclohydrolase/phosphoribosyl-ATP diphosphatase HisIE [Planctomycetota bacterium]
MNDITEHAPKLEIKWDHNGLLPCVLQDARSGDVLTLAYMNAESFHRTLDSGLVTFYSRSRKQLWVKGETSGNTMQVVELKLDCDGDALVARVLPQGPACHTGEKDCFFQTLHTDLERAAQLKAEKPSPTIGWGGQLGQLLEEVRTLLQDRKARKPEGSYSTYLFTKGLDKILKKLGEEATEAIIAAKGEDKNALSGELCDLLFHMLVLMVQKDISLEDLRRVMAQRHQKDEHEAKARDTQVRLSKPEGCEALEQRLMKQVDTALHRDLTRALEVMYRAHAGQKRHGGKAYATHPLEVTLIAVEEVKMRDRNEILAAVLHDVLEDDMKTTPQQLVELFGEDTANAVVLLTKMYKRDGTPKEFGLQRYYDGLRSAPGWVKAVKLCDRVHNLRSMAGTGLTDEYMAKYRKETRNNLLPLAASSVNQSLLKAGDLLLKELYK